MTANVSLPSARRNHDRVLRFIGIACGIAAAFAAAIYFAPIDWARHDLTRNLAWLPEEARSYISPLSMLSVFFFNIDRQGLVRLATGALILALVGGFYTALAYAIWHMFAVSPAILAVIGVVLAVATAIAIFEINLKRRVAAMGEKEVWPKTVSPQQAEATAPKKTGIA